MRGWRTGSSATSRATIFVSCADGPPGPDLPVPVAGVGALAADARFAFFTADGSALHVLMRVPDEADLAQNWAIVTYESAALP